MITDLHIEGFRSLADTSITLRPGLNVLVGPNGAGKTNFLKFLSFLKSLMPSSLDEAMATVGGAGNAFRKLEQDVYGDTIVAVIWGKIPEAKPEYADTTRHVIFYRYDICIKLSENRDNYSITKESLNVSIYSSSSKKYKNLLTKDILENMWDIVIRRTISGEKDFELQINRDTMLRSIKKLFNNMLSIRSFYTQGDERTKRPLLSHVPYGFWQFKLIRDDFNLGGVYNIDPTTAREADDAATRPGIASNGAGLARTIYYLQQKDAELLLSNQGRTFRRAARVGGVRVVPMSRLMDQVRLATEFLAEIRAENDRFTNKITLEVLAATDPQYRMPFAFLSDGTVKWITLVTALLSGADILAVEEPENFLHPTMQLEIVRLVKGIYENLNKPIFFTTHSETLLNACKIEDLIVCQMKDGMTQMRRVDRPESFNETIQRTGFGVGHFYVTGAVESA